MSFVVRQAMNPRRRVVKKPSILGRKNPRWNGGKTISRDGRVLIYSPDHPRPCSGRYVYRYRLKMEKKLGRILRRDEVVHHKDGNPSNDRIGNLQLLSAKEHNAISARTPLKCGWSRNFHRCTECLSTERKHKSKGLCTRCNDRKRWPRRQLKKGIICLK